MKKLVKTVGRAQSGAYGMQTDVIGGKEEFKGEIAKVRVWGPLSCGAVVGAASLRAREKQGMPLLCH